MISRKNNHKQFGFTLVETMVAAVILAFMVSVFASLIAAFNEQMYRSAVTAIKSKEIANLVEIIQNNPRLMQVQWDNSTSAVNSALNTSSLPLAWGKNNKISDPAQCPSCEGRLGFVMRPVAGARGNYLVTMRVTHKRLIVGYQDVDFMVSAK